MHVMVKIHFGEGNPFEPFASIHLLKALSIYLLAKGVVTDTSLRHVLAPAVSEPWRLRSRRLSALCFARADL